ncbi:MAG: DNA alkylation repair protein [Limnohabitans sp.]
MPVSLRPVAAAHAHLLGRKGAARISLIPDEVLRALNAGAIPTANLNEFLAIDLAQLVPAVAQVIGLDPAHERLKDTLAMLSSFKPMKRHGLVSRALYDMAAQSADPDAVAQTLVMHPSDVARCWASDWVRFSGWPLAQQLQAQLRFAADPHFGVREMAWMAVRDEVVANLDTALELLQVWVLEVNENIRRFASELTRPKGVWCTPIKALQAEPQRALHLLEPLRADPSRYVQNSVANWLNDASKTQGPWVESVCARWLDESPSEATRYIVRRARRTIDKA